jgi:hypothetical protein
MWAKIVKSFHDSETIVFARAQVFLSILAAVALPIAHVVFSIDLSPLFDDPKYLIAWLFVSGLVQEFLRKHREDWGDENPPDEHEHVGNNP